MVKRVFGDASECKIQQISLSNDTVKQRINEISDDINERVIQNIKSSPAGMFATQLDESTDVSSCAQLLVFVRYVFLCDVKEEYVLCTQLEITTTAEDVMEKLSSFFRTNRIKLGKLLWSLYRRGSSDAGIKAWVSEACQGSTSECQGGSLYDPSFCTGIENPP